MYKIMNISETRDESDINGDCNFWETRDESDWFSYYLEDRWAFRSTPKISEMDIKWIKNSKKMIMEGRAKICSEPVLAKAYIERFELELLRRICNEV